VKRVARGLAVVVLALSVLLVTPAGRAGADGTSGVAYGDEGTVSIDRKDTGGLFGWACNVTGYFRVEYSVDDNTGAPASAFGLSILGDVACSAGTLMTDTFVTKVEFVNAPAINDDCEYAYSTNKNIDEAADKTFAIAATAAVPGDCLDGDTDWPAPISGVCITYNEGDESTRECEAMTILPPEQPTAGQEWYGSDPAGCAAWSPLVPWVSEYQAVAVSGGWRWESTAILRLTAPASAVVIDGVTGYPWMVAHQSGTGVGIVVLDDGYVGNGPYSGWSAQAFANGAGWKQSRTVKGHGATHTGALGSVPLDWEWSGIGLYWSDRGGGPGNTVGGLTSSSSTRPKPWATRPTTADIAANVGGEYGAHHDPERCHFWWGTVMFPSDTSGYKDPAGPLTFRDNPAPPAPPGTDTSSPPTYDPPTIPEDPSNNPLPDDEGEECDFSISDPSTWGGQLICVLVKVAKGIIGAIGDLLGAIVGLVADLLEGLLDLFLTLFIPDEFPDFSGFGVDLPDGWVGGAPDFGDPGCGPITMPAIELGPMVGATSPTTLVDTCDEPWPMVRGVVYYGVLAVALISIAQRAVLMVLDALGMGIAVYDAMPDQDRGGRK
jgi:hypothetical protein